MNKNKVLQLIKDRKNGARDDRKLALIIQGGGLRTSFAGGVMIALEELGYADVFDCIYGVSAGSCCGAYLLSHQTRLGTSIFYEDLPGFKFIQPWKPHQLINLNHLCDRLMKERKPLDVGTVLKAKTDLRIVLTEAKTGKYTYLSKNDVGADLLPAIKAACTYPGAYFPLVKINGKRYLDGGAVKSLPLQEAVDEGFTDLLIVTTTPKNYKRKSSSWYFLFFSGILVPLLGKATVKNLVKRLRNYNHEVREIFNHHEIFPKVNMAIISPEYYVRSTERNSAVLKKLAEHGEEVALEVLR